MKRIILFPFVSLLLVAGIVTLLLATNLYTFYRLTDESPIAELRFTALGPQEYQATIRYGDFCTPEHYTLHGDQWRLDAQFLKWRPWANLFGFDSMYRIERLGGRYLDIRHENNERNTGYQLYSTGLADLTAILAKYNGRYSPVDTLYGSSVYVEMDTDYVYVVYRGQSGLLVRKTPQTGVADADGIITIEINKSCSSESGLNSRVAQFIQRVTGRAGSKSPDPSD